jgi:hypothetical protein
MQNRWGLVNFRDIAASFVLEWAEYCPRGEIMKNAKKVMPLIVLVTGAFLAASNMQARADRDDWGGRGYGYGYGYPYGYGSYYNPYSYYGNQSYYGNPYASPGYGYNKTDQILNTINRFIR